MSDNNIEKETEDIVEKAADKVIEEAKEEIKKTAEEVSKEIKKAGEKAAKEVKAVGKETEVFIVKENSLVTGKTVQEIDDLGLLGEDALFVEIDREDEIITPKGDTVIKTGDTVTMTSSSGITDKTREAFMKKSPE